MAQAKRFLNVVYESQSTTIDIKNMGRLSEVQKEILVAFPCMSVGYPSAELWEWNGGVSQEIKTLTQLKQLPEDYFSEEDGLFITIELLPENKKRKILFEWQVSSVQQLSYDSHSPVFQLDTDYLADTCLISKKLILYCRPTFH